MAVRSLNPEYIAGVKQVLRNTPFFQLLGMELVDLSDGLAVFRIPAAKKHLNPFNRVHGGVAASILDAASFWAVYSRVDDGLGMTTADLSIDYLGAAEPDRILLAQGEIIKAGKTLGLGTARLTEAETGRLVAFGKASCMVIPMPADGPFNGLPRKFL